MKRLLFCICAVSQLMSGCKAQVSSKKLMANYVLTLYNQAQEVTLMGKIKIWQSDSLFIQQIYINKSLETSQGTTREYVPKFCRFMDLRNRTYYDFRSFSDTSQCFNRGNLPDTFLFDAGYSLHYDSMITFMTPPVLLPDSLIEDKTYHRIKFNSVYDDISKGYSIGLFLAGRKFGLLSMEKKFSQSRDWFLSKILDCNKATGRPFAIREIEFLADTLSPEEERVFDAWEKYARKNPVTQ